MQPDISLILQGSKKAIVTDKKLESTELKFLEILDIGISEEKCKKMNIDVSKLVSKEGYIYCGINIGTARKISKSDFYNKRHEFLQFDEWNEDMMYIPVLKVKKIPEINYIEKYGEPDDIDGFVFKTSEEFEADVMGRDIKGKDIREFNTGIMTRLKDNTSILAFACIYPININPYWGCGFGCIYCYVRFVCGYYGMFTEKGIPANFQNIENEIHMGLHTNKDNILSNLIRKKYPIQIGVNTDPFQYCEEEYKITLKIIDLLNKEKYPFNIITKNPIMASEGEYLRILSEASVLFHVSIPFRNDELAKKMEPNAPSPTDRIKAIKKLVDNGIDVTVRMYPMMVGLNCNMDGSIKGHGYEEFVQELSDCGVSTVMTNTFRRSKSTDSKIKQVTGIDYSKVYEDKWVETYGSKIYTSYLEPITYIRFCKELRKLVVDKHNMLYSPHHCMDLSLFKTGSVCCPIDKLPEEKRKLWKNLHGISVPRLYNILQKEEGKTINFDGIKKHFQFENEEAMEKYWKSDDMCNRSFNWFRDGDNLRLDEDSMTDNVFSFIKDKRANGESKKKKCKKN